MDVPLETYVHHRSWPWHADLNSCSFQEYLRTFYDRSGIEKEKAPEGFNKLLNGTQTERFLFLRF